MIRINIFDGQEGNLIKQTNMSNNAVVVALKDHNAVELYYKNNDNPVSNYTTKYFKTDQDGFASLVIK